MIYLIVFLLLSSCSNPKYATTSVFDKPFKYYNSGNIYKEYYKNGYQKYEIKRMNGKLDGCSRYWNKEGKLINQVCYSNDILHGEWKEFHSNEELKYFIIYNYGLKEGYEYWYHENGKKKSETLYESGEVILKTIRWNKNGGLIY